MDLVTARLARRYHVQYTHDGLVLDFPRSPPSTAAILFGVLGWLVVGSVSLWAIALPVAAFVEAQGWWLVNEHVLQMRWMAYGLAIWPFAFLLLWVAVRGPTHLTHQRVQVDRFGVAWRGRFRWRRVPWSALEALDFDSYRLRLWLRNGRTRRMPAIVPEAALALGRLVQGQWNKARPGDASDVPEDLRELVAESDRAPAPLGQR